MIAVTHDRYFLDNVAGWILELDRERASWKGNYSSWLDQKTKRLEQEEKQASKRRKTLERELDCAQELKRTAGQSKARLSNYDRMLQQERAVRQLEIFIRLVRGSNRGDRGRVGGQRLRRKASLRQPELQTATRRHRGHYRPEWCG